MDRGSHSTEAFSTSVPDDRRDHEASMMSQDKDSAPEYTIPNRIIGSVEVPMIVMNLDRAEMAFGNIFSFTNVLDLERMSIPFYLNPDSPFRRPIMSHNAATHNVLLKVTVPKRTGRKRKRGTDMPFQGEMEMTAIDAAPPNQDEQVCSKSRLDNPRHLRRKLQDNVGNYDVEAVGIIKGTHRFRGLADFHWNMSKSPFISRFMQQVMPGDIGLMKDFKFTEGVDSGPNVDIIPPPMWTPMTLPFNYMYNQNPYVRSEVNMMDEEVLVNSQKPNLVGHVISTDRFPVPTHPQRPPDLSIPEAAKYIAALNEALDERPIWTRRALFNRIGTVPKTTNQLKRYIGFVGYQFRGGPWRDCIIKYGIDPRSDPKYKPYQSVIFHMDKPQTGHIGIPWHAIRERRAKQTYLNKEATSAQSHIFDGKSYWTDGKVWQLCDVTDPLLADLIRTAPTRPAVDMFSSGWFHHGRWAKIKAIMKLKMTAIQFGRRLTDADFGRTLLAGDMTPPIGTASVSIPLPELQLTRAEKMQLYGRRFKEPKRPKRGYTVYHPNRTDHGRKDSPAVTIDSEPSLGNIVGDSDFGDDSGSGFADEDDGIIEMVSVEKGRFAMARHGGDDGEGESDEMGNEEDMEANLEDYEDEELDEDENEMMGVYEEGNNESDGGGRYEYDDPEAGDDEDDGDGGR